MHTGARLNFQSLPSAPSASLGYLSHTVPECDVQNPDRFSRVSVTPGVHVTFPHD